MVFCGENVGKSWAMTENEDFLYPDKGSSPQLVGIKDTAMVPFVL